MPEPAKDFVSSFLEKTVKKRKLTNEENGLEKTLQRKVLMLDTVRVPKAKKRRKLKMMSARERKSKGIYKLTPENQKYAEVFLQPNR